MNYNPRETTVPVKTCRVCGTPLLASSRFCRLCGASQGHLEFVTRRHEGLSEQPQTTTIRAQDGNSNALSPMGRYRSVSGSVLNSFVTADLTTVTSRLRSRAAKSAVAAAIAIPLWAMIVLLSPIEALEASRQMTRQV